jgi:hypothetical protein
LDKVVWIINGRVWVYRISKSSVLVFNRSRSRDRDHNRTGGGASPHFPKRSGVVSGDRVDRRSPRRAPPFSPSPPPSRYPKKEKDEYYRDEHHSRSVLNIRSYDFIVIQHYYDYICLLT